MHNCSVMLHYYLIKDVNKQLLSTHHLQIPVSFDPIYDHFIIIQTKIALMSTKELKTDEKKVTNSEIDQ